MMRMKKEEQGSVHWRSDRGSKGSPTTWGDTLDGEGEFSKMIYVSNISAQLKIDEVKDFFRPCGRVVGVHISVGRFAIVKFERPNEATQAVSLDTAIFQTRSLKIRHWEPNRPNKPVKPKLRGMPPRARSPSPSRSRGEVRPRRGGRSRSRSRSRSRGSSPYHKRHRESNNNLPRRSSARQNPFVHTNENDKNGPLDGDYPSWVASHSTDQPELPKQIALLLNLVLTDATARTLSLAQLTMLRDYFAHEMEFVWGHPEDTHEQNGPAEPPPQQPEPEPEHVNKPQQENVAEVNLDASPKLDGSDMESDDEQRIQDHMREMIQKATGRKI